MVELSVPRSSSSNALMRYDLIVVGGGLAGSALAGAMAETGAHVLVLEREHEFRDRVRGEGMHPWGVPEIRALGLSEPMKSAGAAEIRWWVTYRGSTLLARRDLPETTPFRHGALNFFHPTMQEALLRRAAAAGAEVRRGATVTEVRPGEPPAAVVSYGDGQVETMEARLIVGADGRRSRARQWGGFDTRHDEKRLAITGVLVKGMKVEENAIQIFRLPSFGQSVLLFPLGNAGCRAYFVSGRRSEHRWLSRPSDFGTFLEYCCATGVPADWLTDVEVAGPLATFEAADSWVETPYRHGVVLVGDAAASSDPSWGCGLSLMFRDVRTLRDGLTSSTDWQSAAAKYAIEHDDYYGRLRTVISWLRTLLYGLGPTADEIREHAFARIAEGPDLVGKGPDNRTDDAARIQFLGQ